MQGREVESVRIGHLSRWTGAPKGIIEYQKSGGAQSKHFQYGWSKDRGGDGKISSKQLNFGAGFR